MMSTSLSDPVPPPPIVDQVTMDQFPFPKNAVEFLSFCESVPYHRRVKVSLHLAQTYSLEQLLPLLYDLFDTPLETKTDSTTTVVVHHIKIVQPKPADELNPDGGDPSPVTELVALPAKLYPPTGPTGYFQREQGLRLLTLVVHNAMATPDSRVIELLGTQLNHSMTPGRKGLVQCLTRFATDEEILKFTKDSVAAVKTLMIEVLEEGRRGKLAKVIRGDVSPTAIENSVKESAAPVPIITRLQEAVKESLVPQRHLAWEKVGSLLDGLKSRDTKTSLTPTGSDPGEFMNAILDLQESHPIVRGTKISYQDNQYPVMAPIILRNLWMFLKHDADRVIKIAKQTSWYRNVNGWMVSDMLDLAPSKKFMAIWTRREDNGLLLKSYLEYLISLNHGELVKRGQFQKGLDLLKVVRAPVLGHLAITVLPTILEESMNDYSVEETQGAVKVNKPRGQKIVRVDINQCRAVWTAIKSVLVVMMNRLKKIVKLIHKPIAHGLFVELVENLIRVYFSSAFLQLDKFYRTPEEQFRARDILIQSVINPILVSDPGMLKVYPKFVQLVFEQIKERVIDIPFDGPFTTNSAVCSTLLRSLAAEDTKVSSFPGDDLEPAFTFVPKWSNDQVFEAVLKKCSHAIKKEKKKKTGTKETEKEGVKEVDTKMVEMTNDEEEDEEFVAISASAATPDEVDFTASATTLPVVPKKIFDVKSIDFWTAIASELTIDQRNRVVALIPDEYYIEHLKNVLRIEKDRKAMFENLHTSVERRHEILYPFVFGDQKTLSDLKDVRHFLAQYLDIRDSATREAMEKMTYLPLFDDRFLWYKAIFQATLNVGTVREWITTVKWLTPRTRNEIQPNLVMLNTFINSYGFRRQFLLDATLEEAEELKNLYLTLDILNTTGVSRVYGTWVERLGEQALSFYLNQPSHPFFTFATQIRWRQVMDSQGDQNAFGQFHLNHQAIQYTAITPATDEEEIKRRTAVQRGKDFLKTEGASSGLWTVMEGDEELFVRGILQEYETRYDSVKFRMNPKLDPTKSSFKESNLTSWQQKCLSLCKALGWRWKRSETLVSYVEELIQVLEKAPIKLFGKNKDEKILDWSKLHTTINAISELANMYNSRWLSENRSKVGWYDCFRKLRFQSTQNSTEVQLLLGECVDESGKTDQVKRRDLLLQFLNQSRSAIHLSEVRIMLVSERQDLLTDDILDTPAKYSGLFNQVSDDEAEGQLKECVFDDCLIHIALLSTHQGELLMKRTLKRIMDTGIPIQQRVTLAEAYVGFPTVTIHDIADLLAVPSLPVRITEALLMHLPKHHEPVNALPILLAPVYLGSHLARTAIYAVKSALEFASISDSVELIRPIFPPEGEKQSKVTVQKEAVRLICGGTSLDRFADPITIQFVRELWQREKLHKDTRMIMIQSMLNVLATMHPFKAEGCWKDAWDLAWMILQDAANNKKHSESLISLALLRVHFTIPVHVTERNSRSNLRISFEHVPVMPDLLLNSLAIVTLPYRIKEKYMDTVWFPLMDRVEKTTENLTNVRSLAWDQLIKIQPGHIWSHRASEFAVQWRQEIIQNLMSDSKKECVIPWKALLLGINVAICELGKVDLANAATNAEIKTREAEKAWRQVVGVVEDLVTVVVDLERSKKERQEALNRLKSLSLGHFLFPEGFHKLSQLGVFDGQAMDVVEPIVRLGIENMFWEEIMNRELTFQTQRIASKVGKEQEREQVALDVFEKLVRLSKLYISDPAQVMAYMPRIMGLFANPKEQKTFLRTILNDGTSRTTKNLTDWEYYNNLCLYIISNKNSLWRNLEMGDMLQFMNRIGTDEDLQDFYGENYSQFVTTIQQLAAGISAKCRQSQQAALQHSDLQGVKTANEIAEAEFAPMVELMGSVLNRAKKTGWKSGPDTAMARLMLRDMSIYLYHYQTTLTIELMENTLEIAIHDYTNVDRRNQVTRLVDDFVYFCALCPVQRHVEGTVYQSKAEAIPMNHGMSPVITLLIEGLLKGQFHGIELKDFMAVTHTLPLETVRGLYFPATTADKPETVLERTMNRSSVQAMENDWKFRVLPANSGYFQKMSQALAKSKGCPTSTSTLFKAYQSQAVRMIQKYPNFILVRPNLYLDHMRLSLTRPYAQETPYQASQAILTALSFHTSNAPAAQHGVKAFEWAPPFSLGLDVLEILTGRVLQDAMKESARDGWLIEQVAGLVLVGYINKMNSPQGQLLLKQEFSTEKDRQQRLVQRVAEIVKKLSKNPGSGAQGQMMSLVDIKMPERE